MSKLPVSKRVKTLARNFHKTINTIFSTKNSGLNISISNGLEQVGDINYTGENEAEIEVRGISEGEQTVEATYENSEPKTATVLVRPMPAKLSSIDPVKTDIIQTESCVFTLTFDKPLVDGQGYPIVSVSENLEYSTPFTINGDRTGGTFEVTGKVVGTGKVTCTLGGVILESDVAIKDIPAELLTVTFNPEHVQTEDIVTIIADHDKTPLAENLIFTPSQGLELYEDISISGTTATVKYKAIAVGDQRVDVQSHRITKFVTFNVEAKPIVYPVLQSISANPDDVLKGSNVEITLTFDKKEHLITSDIAMLLPENVTEVTPLTISEDDNTVKATYLIESDTLVDISATYKEVTKTANINVRIPAIIESMVDDPDEIIQGNESTITVTYDKNKEADQIDAKFTVSEGLEISQDFSGNEAGGTLKVRSTSVPESGIGTVTGNFGGSTKTVDITITPKPATLQSVTADPDTIRKNTDVRVIATFDKAPELLEVQFEPHADLTEKEAPKIVGNTVVATYTSNENIGDKTVKVTHNLVEKSTTIHVVADAIVNTVTPNKDTAEMNEEITFTVAFDKEFVEGQDALEVEYPEGFSETEAFSMNPENNGGTVKGQGSTPGEKTITVKLGGTSKTASVTILDSVKPTSINADPTSVSIGGKSTVTVDLNRAIDNPDLLTVQLTEGLIGPSKVTLIEEGLKGTLEVTGKTAGTQSVTISANSTVKSVEINVVADPQITSFESDPASGYPNETVFKCTAVFDKKPASLEDVVFTPSEGLVESVPKAFDGNNVTVSYTANTTGAKTVDVEFKGQTKQANITVNEKSAVLTNMTATNLAQFSDELTDVVVTCEFDKPPVLETLNLHVESEEFTLKTPAAISGNTITATYTPIKAEAGSYKITANYNEVQKEVTLVVTAKAVANGCTIDKPFDYARPGDVITAKLSFDKALPEGQDQPTVSATSGLTVKGEVTLAEDRTYVTQEFTVGEELTEQTVTFAGIGGSPLTATITPEAKAVLQSITAEPETVDQGGEVTIVATFDKNAMPSEASIIVESDQFDITEELHKVEENQLTGKVTAKTVSGIHEIKVSHNSVEKSDIVNVRDGATLQSASVTPTSAEVGEVVTFTAVFDKAPNLELASINPDPAHFDVQEAAKVDDVNIVAKYTVKGEPGQAAISISHNSVSKSAEVTVSAATPITLSSLDIEPKSVETNGDAVVTGIFNKAGADIGKVEISVPEGVTDKGDKKIDGTTLTFTVTGTSAGEDKQISVTYDSGEAKTVNLTVTDPVPPITMDSATPDPSTINVGDTTVVTVSFSNGTPEVGKIHMTPNEFLTESVGPAVSGNTITATYQGASAGAGTVTVTYDGIDDPKTVSITVQESARIESMTADNPTPVAGENFNVNIKFSGTPNLGE